MKYLILFCLLFSPSVFAQNKTCGEKLVEAKAVAEKAISEAQKANEAEAKAILEAQRARENYKSILEQRDDYREERDTTRTERDVEAGRNLELRLTIFDLNLKNSKLEQEKTALEVDSKSNSRQRWWFLALGVVGGSVATVATFKVLQ